MIYVSALSGYKVSSEPSPLTLKDTMSSYRDCPSGEYCASYPCRHSPSQDPDYAFKLRDQYENPELSQEAITCHLYPKRLETLPAILKPMIMPRVERLRRIDSKCEQITAELKIFRERLIAEGRLDSWAEQGVPKDAVDELKAEPKYVVTDGKKKLITEQQKRDFMRELGELMGGGPEKDVERMHDQDRAALCRKFGC